MQKDRRDKIEEMIGAKAFVSIRELKELFPDISEMTLRRDISYFEEEGKIVRVRGGFRSKRSLYKIGSTEAHIRDALNIESKYEISLTAESFLESGTSIFIDSGSTMRIFAKHIPILRFSITTTDPAVALKLSENSLAAVNIVGGRLDFNKKTVTGLQASGFLSGINIDTAFLSASAFNEASGFSVAGYNECELKKIVISKARRVIMLIDSSKYGKELPYTFGLIDDADIIITDKNAPTELTNIAARHGTEVIIAGRR